MKFDTTSHYNVSTNYFPQSGFNIFSKNICGRALFFGIYLAVGCRVLANIASLDYPQICTLFARNTFFEVHQKQVQAISRYFSCNFS